MSKCIALGVLLAAGSAAMGQVLYTNGSLNPVATSLNGTPAPVGASWSECQNDAGVLDTANTTAGFGCGSPNGTDFYYMGDDFTVPAGQTWNVTGMKFYGYQTGASSTASPLTGVVVQIFSDNPMTNPSAPVVFGDQTTNRMASQAFSGVYRIFSTLVPPACGGVTTAPGTTRAIWEVNANAVVSLPAGTYWMLYGFKGSASFSGPWAPLDTLLGARLSNPLNNAMQSTAAGGTGWVTATDAGQGCAPVPVNVDTVFVVMGAQGSACYPDCNGDGVLNLSDFGCFTTKFALGDPYADCNGDGIRNLSDFGCFTTKFALGCP